MGTLGAPLAGLDALLPVLGRSWALASQGDSQKAAASASTKFGAFSSASRPRAGSNSSKLDGNGPAFMVIASDGLWDFVRANRVGDIVAAASRGGAWERSVDGAEVAKSLCAEARASGSQDDITVLVVRFIE